MTQAGVVVKVWELSHVQQFAYQHVLHWVCPITFRIRGCIQKFPDWVDNEIFAYLRYYSL